MDNIVRTSKATANTLPPMSTTPQAPNGDKLRGYFAHPSEGSMLERKRGPVLYQTYDVFAQTEDGRNLLVNDGLSYEDAQARVHELTEALNAAATQG